MGLRQSIAGTAEWAAHVGSDVGCSPIAYLRFSLIVWTSSTRVVLLDFDGRTGLVFLVEGLPDMHMVTSAEVRRKASPKLRPPNWPRPVNPLQ